MKKIFIAGNIVDIACNDTVSKVPSFYEEIGCNIYTIHTSRSPLSKGNIIAIKQNKNPVKAALFNFPIC